MLFTSEYNSSVLQDCFRQVTSVVQTVAREESIPTRIVECCIVGGFLPLYLPRWLFYDICNQASIDYSEGLGLKLLNRLSQEGLIQNKEYLYCRREVLYTVGNLSPLIKDSGIFKSTINFLLDTVKNPVDKRYFDNKYIIHYYNDKSLFMELVNSVIEKQVVTQLITLSQSLRALLDLESTSSNIKFLERLYLTVVKHISNKRELEENIISFITQYDKENLSIYD